MAGDIQVGFSRHLNKWYVGSFWSTGTDVTPPNNRLLERMCMNSSDHVALAQRFAVAVAELDEAALHHICTEDVSWTIPGDSSIAGRNEGVEGILAIQRTLRRRELKAEVVQILHGRESFVAWLHDTGERDGRSLDVFVALLFDLRDGRISRITGHISDVAMFSAYVS